MSPPSFLYLLITTLLFIWLPHDSRSVDFGKSNQDPSSTSQQPSADEKQRLLEQAQLLYQQQKFDALVPVLERALAIREKELGPQDPRVAGIAGMLGMSYFMVGNYARAEPQLLRALQSREKSDPRHPDIARLTNILANVYINLRDYERADQMFQRSREIKEAFQGFENPVTGTPPNVRSVSDIHAEFIRNEKALLDELAGHEKASSNQQILTDLNSLAVLYNKNHDYVRAEQMLRRALSIREKVLGLNHPEVVSAVDELAMACWAKGDAAEAVRLLTRNSDIREQNFSSARSTAPPTPEEVRLGLPSYVERAVWLNLRSLPKDREATRLALLSLLRSKGRVRDLKAKEIAALRESNEVRDVALLEKLTTMRSRYAALVFNDLLESNNADVDGPTILGLGGARPQLVEPSKETTELGKEIEQLEQQASSRGVELMRPHGALTLESVQQTIPATAALVEMLAYTLYDPKWKSDYAWNATRLYAAYVLKREGDPVLVDLGVAPPIDECAKAFRKTLRDPRRTDVKSAGRCLDEQVMKPIRKELGDVRMILLSPDSQLNLVPFSALVDEQDHYLIEKYSFTYLTSGRDLLRMKVNVPSKQGPVILADPDFGKPAPEADRSSNLLGNFESLPGTRDEAEALGALLKNATVSTQQDASEKAVKQLRGPSILHIATHGFFLPFPERDMASFGLPGLKLTLPLGKTARTADPMLQVGLVMAGANNRQDADGEDGFLTGYEAAGLNLSGTKLAVLSACETGLGEVALNVYGLRVSLLLAGAETQVTTLWKVDDRATRELMVDYYKRLQAGEGRSEALRQAQLAMLRRNDHSHPYFWASFIPLGNWRSLDGKDVLAK